jgi:hypothetical protein
VSANVNFRWIRERKKLTADEDLQRTINFLRNYGYWECVSEFPVCFHQPALPLFTRAITSPNERFVFAPLKLRLVLLGMVLLFGLSTGYLLRGISQVVDSFNGCVDLQAFKGFELKK